MSRKAIQLLSSTLVHRKASWYRASQEIQIDKKTKLLAVAINCLVTIVPKHCIKHQRSDTMSTRGSVPYAEKNIRRSGEEVVAAPGQREEAFLITTRYLITNLKALHASYISKPKKNQSKPNRSNPR